MSHHPAGTSKPSARSPAFPATCLRTLLPRALGCTARASLPPQSWMEEHGGVEAAGEIVAVPSLLAQLGKININFFTPNILNLSLSP